MHSLAMGRRRNKRLHPTAYHSIFQRLFASIGTCK